MKTRVYQIDLFRFFAAIFVMFFHFTCKPEMQGVFPGIEKFAKYGYMGVSFFFMISGFVILLSVEHHKINVFIKARVIRLYPVYWFCLLLTIVIIVFFGQPENQIGWKQFILNLTMVQKKLGADHVDPSYWTLWIEMKFYILVCVYLFLRNVKSFNNDFFVFSWLILASIVSFFTKDDNFLVDVLYKVFIVSYSFYFIAGMIFFKIFTKGILKKYIFGLFTCLVFAIFHELKNSDYLGRNMSTVLSEEIVVGVIILMFLAMFLVSLRKLNFINNKGLLSLGMLTYPLYLLHQTIGDIIFDKFIQVNNKVVLVVLIIMLVSTSFLISRFFERPIVKFLKEKFS